MSYRLPDDGYYKQNKMQYESSLNIGKSLLEIILRASNPEDINFKDKLKASNVNLNKTFTSDERQTLDKGFTNHNLNELDLSMLNKLVRHLCQLEKKAPNIHSDLMVLKENRNELAHSADAEMFNDLFVWPKIEELRALYEKILDGIKDFYGNDIDGDKKVINRKLDRILKSFQVEVGSHYQNLGKLCKHMRELGKCPFKVKIEAKFSPERCHDLEELLERLSKENTKVSLLLNEQYFKTHKERNDFSKKYLLPLLDKESKCQLIMYRGGLSNEMIPMLPSTVSQLYVRLRIDQMNALNSQLSKMPGLWSLSLFLDFHQKIENDNVRVQNHEFIKLDLVDPSSLPALSFKGKQLGLKFYAFITIDHIPWIVAVIKQLTKNHQCDTLEFYDTELQTEGEVEKLLRAMNEADIVVTTWVKLMSADHEMNSDHCEEEERLNEIARNLRLRKFAFLAEKR